MANGENGGCVFPLTSLQIGDLQSYLSDLSLFLASESGRLYILVDNWPWLKDLVSPSTHLWQLMVTKSRLSPFANTRGKKEMKIIEEVSELHASSSSKTSGSGILKKWFSVVDAVTLSKKRALLPVKKLRNSLIANSKLHRTLYGFIVFEVAWSDVRGINYLNELQTDTSLAIEAKIMRRWEFDSTTQAFGCISSWFPGELNDQIRLKEHLNASLEEVFHDAREGFSKSSEVDIDDIVCNDMCQGDESPYSLSSSFSVYPAIIENNMNRLHTPHFNRASKRSKVLRSIYCNAELAVSSGEEDSDSVEFMSLTSDASTGEETLEATLYRDVLILFRFNDHDLPFILKDRIMSDLRLLTLLESGLPSWVIFLQSYPVFCRFYRPWMCPLVRALYVLVSFVTVLIGFYDLYKNVPLLKATASGLFGPLFDWIENDFKKTICGALCFLPSIVEYVYTIVENIFSVSWMVVESSFTMVGDLVEILLMPLCYIILVLWNIVISVIYPIVWILGGILYASFRLVLGFCSLVASSGTFLYNLVGDVWLFASSIFQFTRGVESTVNSYEVSAWHTLWNDIFSRVFRALRSILNGLAAFFTACNRHRLSIYNHLKEFIQRLSCAARRRGHFAANNRTVQISDAQITESSCHMCQGSA